MKTTKKLLAILLSVVMMLAMGVTAFADGGSGSITISNATIGEEYNVYKVFDLTYATTGNGVAYTYTKTGENDALFEALNGTGSPFTLTQTTTASVYNVSTTSDAATIANFLKGLVSAGTLTASAAAITPTMENQDVEFSGLALGYYYVSSTLGSVVTITSTTPDATVIDKNTQEPTPSDDDLKTIIVNGEKVNSTTASVGDVLSFRIALNTVNWVTKAANGQTTTEQVTTYTITDTPSNMAIKEGTVVVKVGSTTLGADAYTLNIDENGKMTVVVTWANNGTSLYANGSLLEVTYDAEITSAAANGTASNSASAGWNDSEPFEDETTVYTYSFDLNKVDGSNNALTGAKFELYDAATGGNKIALVKENDGSYRPATPEEKAVAGFESAVIEAGRVTIKGLGNGNYWLEETEAPAGYNKLTSRESLTINGASLTGNAAIKVVNEAGAELPSTGGTGTTIFYVLGAILVLGAGVVLVSRRRMSAEK